MALASGRLRHKVELQEQVMEQDSNGDVTTEWQTIARPWAAIEPLSARDFISAQAQQSEVRGRITIRRRENINATMQIVYRGLVYRILGVLNDPDSGLEYQTLAVSEGAVPLLE